MKIKSGWFYLGGIFVTLLPVFQEYVGLRAPTDFDYLRSNVMFGIFIICGILVDGFNAVLNKLDGKK